MSGRMQDKVVLVCGAGASGPGWGNGKAAAVLYAREGAKVFAVDRVLSAARETRDLIAAEGGVCEVFEADVSVHAEVRALTQACVARFGRLDVLHNNVGIVETGGVVEASEESWNRVIANNQTSVFLTCKEAIPHMLRQGQGVIVNIGSVAGLRWIGFPYIAYSAAKAAMIAMTRDIALQYAGQGIRANCIVPGLLNTPLVRGALTGTYGGDVEDMIAQRDRLSPTGRMGDAWDVAWASVFLASDESRYITGTHLVIDGGLSGRSVEPARPEGRM
jgi:NAD(P)-dependent dehydrogenase (short-subunit alcohol dehydrogenase family)